MKSEEAIQDIANFMSIVVFIVGFIPSIHLYFGHASQTPQMPQKCHKYPISCLSSAATVLIVGGFWQVSYGLPPLDGNVRFIYRVDSRLR
jgi:hypothetical protein